MQLSHQRKKIGGKRGENRQVLKQFLSLLAFHQMSTVAWPAGSDKQEKWRPAIREKAN
jgi:hypothetical protein